MMFNRDKSGFNRSTYIYIRHIKLCIKIIKKGKQQNKRYYQETLSEYKRGCPPINDPVTLRCYLNTNNEKNTFKNSDY